VVGAGPACITRAKRKRFTRMLMAKTTPTRMSASRGSISRTSQNPMNQTSSDSQNPNGTNMITRVTTTRIPAALAANTDRTPN
jgi:hypothetical protein